MRRFLLLLILVACSSPPKQPEILRISFNMQPTTLDPRKAGDFVSSTLICMIYDGLTRCLPSGAVEPALAERCEISKDQKTYLFYLRKAFWSDGKPITAYDFEASWKEIIASPSFCTYLFYAIKNGEKCAKGELPIEEVGIQALNDGTLRVELEYPTPYFYALTAFPAFLPVPAHIDDATVYSGPFRIAKMITNSEIVLTKNQTYWNKTHVFLDQIHISIVFDEMTALQMFERGNLDWLGGPHFPLPPDSLEKLKNQLQFIPSAATTLVTFNTKVSPFSNPHLRKAFSYAINRTEIVEKVVGAGQIPASTLLPPSLSSNKNVLHPIRYNPEEARLHLQKALKELEIAPSALDTLILYFKSNQMDKRLAQTLQRQWQETLGVSIQLVGLDPKSHAQRLQTRDYQISLAIWIAPFDDPISILERFKDKANLKNYPDWEDAEYVRLLNEATGSKRRSELLQSAEERLAAELPLTPIYHWSSPTLCSPHIASLEITPSGSVLFERFRLNK